MIHVDNHSASTLVEPKRPTIVLTDTQLSVIRLVADGMTDDLIAARLYMSPHTVHTHLGRIYNRLGAANRAHAVAICLRQGSIE